MSTQDFNATASPFTVEMGRDHEPARIREYAARNMGYDLKKPLLQGALEAYSQRNRLDKLVAFVTGYLELKRRDGALLKFENDVLDDGVQHLVCKPLINLLEQKRQPQEDIAQLAADLSPLYHQALLDMLLRYAATENSWALIPELHRAGAEINAGNGRALLNAALKNNARSILALVDCGADIARARAICATEKQAEFDDKIADAQKRFKVEAPRLLAPRLQPPSTGLRLSPEKAPKA